MLYTSTVHVGAKPLSVTAVAVLTGDGITVTLATDEHSHVGAVALAEPRPSLADPRTVSASVSVLTVTGHKDDEPACCLARMLAVHLNQRVVVTCGLHVDAATPAQVATMLDYVQHIGKLLIKRLETLQRVQQNCTNASKNA